MPITLNGTTGITSPGGDTSTSLTTSGLTVGTTPIGVGDSTRFKNRIINGDMRIDQRNAGANGTASVYTVDRWYYAGSQASKGTWQQNAGAVTPPAGFSNYLGFTSSSSYAVTSGDYFAIGQPIEGFNIADLDFGKATAKTVTLSFWVRSSLTGTFGGALQNSGVTRSYPFSYSIPTANTWTQISITIAGDTSGTWLTTNGTGVTVNFSLGYGTTYSGTAGVWSGNNYGSATGATSVVGTNGATFYITGVQLEVGSSATGFEYVDYTTQLLMCQRYFQISPSIQAVTSFATQTDLTGAFSLWTPMRANPTASLNGSPQFHKPGIAFYNITSVASGPTATGGSYTTLVIASGAGTGVGGQAVAPLKLDAEL